MFKKGEMILFQGEAPKFSYVVKRGIIKTYNLSSQGDEQLMHLNTAFDIFPFAWLMGQGPSALYYYEALTDCELYCMPREQYLNFIKNDPVVLYQELEKSARRDVSETLRLNALLQPKASAKLINTLYYLAKTHGTVLKNKHVRLDIILTQQDLANLTGLTRETVAIELNNLKRQGVINYRPHSPYELDITKTKKRLADQFLAEAKLRA